MVRLYYLMVIRLLDLLSYITSLTPPSWYVRLELLHGSEGVHEVSTALYAPVVKKADTQGLGPCVREDVQVRFLSGVRFEEDRDGN